MNIAKLRVDLELDEGIKHEVYLDHLHLKTVGIGHLCREDEPEFEMEVGTPVSKERVQLLFERDLDAVRVDCIKLYRDFVTLPEDAQLIIANMMFNLGLPRLSKFKLMKAAVEAGDWEEAANQMEQSKWYRQVPNRAERLCNRMRLLAVPV
jgi:lysozyme